MYIRELSINQFTSLTSLLGMPALSTAALTTIAPSSVAVTFSRLPLKEPIGVLTADTITTSFRERFEGAIADRLSTKVRLRTRPKTYAR